MKNVIKWIENNSNIEINAIGIGHDVTNYYKNALKIADVSELGDAIVDRLVDLFTKNQLEEDRLIKKKFNKISLKGINKDSAIIILTQKSPIDNVTQGTPVLENAIEKKIMVKKRCNRR